MDEHQIVEFIASKAKKFYNIVDEDSTLSLDVVESGIEAVSAPHGTLPLRVYEQKNGQSTPVDHPIDSLIRHPTPIVTRQHFTHAMNTDLVLQGNAYAEIVRDKSGKPIMLNQIEAKYFSKIRFNSGKFWYIFYVGDEQKMKSIKSDNIIHLRWNPRGPYAIGEGLLKRAKKDVQYNLDLRSFLNAKTNDHFSGRVLVSHDPALTSDDVDRLEGRARKHQQDPDDLFILDNRAKIERTEYALKDNSIDVLLQSGEKRLANRFKLPLHYFNIFMGNASYNSLEIETNRYKDKLHPWGRIWCDEFELKLLSAEERSRYKIQYNYDALIRVNLKDKVDVIEKQLSNGIITLNRACELLNLPSAGDYGERRRIPLNIGYADEVGVTNQLLSNEIERFAKHETNAIAKKFKAGKHDEVLDDKTKSNSQNHLYSVLRHFEPTHNFDAKKISEQAINDMPLADFDAENLAKYRIQRWSQILRLIDNSRLKASA